MAAACSGWPSRRVQHSSAHAWACAAPRSGDSRSTVAVHESRRPAADEPSGKSPARSLGHYSRPSRHARAGRGGGRSAELLARVRVEVVDAALHLRGGGAQLEAEGAVVELLPQRVERDAAHVLQRVLEPRVQVRQEALERALIDDGTRDALRDTHGRVVGEVAVGRVLVHRVDRTHPAVPLQPHAVLVKVLAGRLLGAGEQRAHHHAARARRERLVNLANVGDAAVGPARHAVLARVLADVEDGRRLRPPHRHHLLRRADGARAHPDAQPVDAPRDQVLGLLHGDDVAADDLDVREGRLDVGEHVLLESGVALRRVDDEDVGAGLDQLGDARLVGGARVHGRADDQSLLLVLGREREVAVLAQVLARDGSDELVALVDDGQLALLRVLQDLVGLLEGAALECGDDVGRHDVGNLLRAVLDKVVVARRDDADEAAAQLAVLGDGATGEAVLVLDLVEL
mmetsp:Transcript_24960/g.66960  ORF Transcript_24960/g.66960 Transcript_24960/m.66960 type:complete len:458 (+) Transcript_24960:210-1583(+)